MHQNIRIFSNLERQNGIYVSWYHETCSVIPIYCNNGSIYGETPPVLNKIKQQVRNLWDRRAAESQARSGRPESPVQRIQIVATYFNWRPGTSQRLSEWCLTFPRSSMPRLLRNRLHTLLYNIKTVQQPKDGQYAARTWFIYWCL